jgi:hypothetical protein
MPMVKPLSLPLGCRKYAILLMVSKVFENTNLNLLSFRINTKYQAYALHL